MLCICISTTPQHLYGFECLILLNINRRIENNLFGTHVHHLMNVYIDGPIILLNKKRVEMFFNIYSLVNEGKPSTDAI